MKAQSNSQYKAYAPVLKRPSNQSRGLIKQKSNADVNKSLELSPSAFNDNYQQSPSRNFKSNGNKLFYQKNIQMGDSLEPSPSKIVLTDDFASLNSKMANMENSSTMYYEAVSKRPLNGTRPLSRVSNQSNNSLKQPRKAFQKNPLSEYETTTATASKNPSTKSHKSDKTSDLLKMSNFISQQDKRKAQLKKATQPLSDGVKDNVSGLGKMFYQRMAYKVSEPKAKMETDFHIKPAI